MNPFLVAVMLLAFSTGAALGEALYWRDRARLYEKLYMGTLRKDTDA